MCHFRSPLRHAQGDVLPIPADSTQLNSLTSDDLLKSSNGDSLLVWMALSTAKPSIGRVLGGSTRQSNETRSSASKSASSWANELPWVAAGSPTFVIADWPTTPENVPEHLECIKDVIIDLLSLSEGELARQILVAQQWVRDTSEPMLGVTFLIVTRSLFSKFLKTQGESHLTLLNRLFPYYQAGMDDFAGLNAQLPRALQPLSPNYLVFGPQDIPQSFWTQLSLLANQQKKPRRIPQHAVVRVSSHWRPYPCKKQIEFVAQSCQGKSSSQANSQGNPVEMINLPKPPLDSSKLINPRSNGGSFQGDWSF